MVSLQHKLGKQKLTIDIISVVTKDGPSGAVIFCLAFHMNTNLMLNTCHPYRDFKTCCF